MIRKMVDKLVIASIVMAAVAAAAWAQPPGVWTSSRLWEPQGAYCRLFDAKHVVTLKGTVQRVEKIVPMKGMGYGIHLILKTDTETIPVHLGPTWYVESQPVKIQVKDMVEVTGSRVYCNGKPIILSAHVTRGGETVSFRKLNGFPLWAGWGH